MADAGQYGQVDIPGIPADEPVFVFRAQDPLLNAALRSYHRQCRLLDVAMADQDGIDVRRAEIFQWQVDNPERVKDRPGTAGTVGQVRSVQPSHLDGFWPDGSAITG